MHGFWSGLLAGYGIAMPIGAVSVLIMTIGMRSGFRTAFMAGAGAATADLIYATAAATAGSALIGLLEPVSLYLGVSGGVALMALAAYGTWKGLRPPRETQADAARGPWATYAQLLGITLVNPLTVVYFTALVLGGGSESTPTMADKVLFVPGAALASLSWQTLLAGLGGVLGSRMPLGFRRGATVLGNLIVATLGVRIIVLALR